MPPLTLNIKNCPWTPTNSWQPLKKWPTMRKYHQQMFSLWRGIALAGTISISKCTNRWKWSKRKSKKRNLRGDKEMKLSGEKADQLSSNWVIRPSKCKISLNLKPSIMVVIPSCRYRQRRQNRRIFSRVYHHHEQEEENILNLIHYIQINCIFNQNNDLYCVSLPGQKIRTWYL